MTVTKEKHQEDMPISGILLPMIKNSAIIFNG